MSLDDKGLGYTYSRFAPDVHPRRFLHFSRELLHLGARCLVPCRYLYIYTRFIFAFSLSLRGSFARRVTRVCLRIARIYRVSCADEGSRCFFFSLLRGRYRDFLRSPHLFFFISPDFIYVQIDEYV